jgi:predicted transcriptional regulator
MTKLLDEAIAKIQRLPEPEQDLAAEFLLTLVAKPSEPVKLDAETQAAIQGGIDQADRGEFVSDEEMAAFFARRGA